MERALVAYDSDFGNTRQAAEEIARGISMSGLVATTIVADVERLTPARVEEFDILVIGSPNHRGNASIRVRRFIRRLGGKGFQGKRLAVFDTCCARQTGRASRQIRAAVNREDPRASFQYSGLSLVMESRNGPFGPGELDRCWQFGQRIAGLV